MATLPTITATTIQDTTYYETEHKGVKYTCYFAGYGQWCVHSSRIALGPRNVGSCRHFKDIDLLANSIKAFSQLPQLLHVPAAVTLH